MARRKNEEADATRLEVLDAAEWCFRHRGSARASVASIATLAGWSRGAANYHFQDKAALLRAVVTRGRLPLEQDLARIAREKGPALPALRHCAQGWMDQLQCNQHARDTFGILAWAYDHADDLADLRDPLQASAIRALRRLRELLRRAESAGELREGLSGRDGARLLAQWWLGAAALCVATPYRSASAFQPRRACSVHAAFSLISRAELSHEPSEQLDPSAGPREGGRRKPAVRRSFFGGARTAPGPVLRLRHKSVE